jgi:phosphoglycolate phosphatase
MIKACLFDLDGTLLDTITTISYYANMALEKFGIEPIEKDKYNYFVGNGAKILIERMLRERNVYTDDTFKKVYDFYVKSYDADTTYLTEAYDGIIDMLTELKNRGIKAGVISNKPDYATRSVCAKKIDSSLLHTVRGQIEGIRIKPDTEGALNVLKLMEADPAETMYIGDTGVDMQTGKNLGAYTVGVLWGFRKEDELRDNGADRIISHPKEIISVIDEINVKQQNKKI